MGILKDILKLFKGKATEEMRPLLSCPNCPETFLTEKEKMGVALYICPECSGCFLTQLSLNNFLNFHNEEDWPHMFEIKPGSPHTFERSKFSRNCPACKDKMDNVEFQYKSGIWVDYCPNGQGIWLDQGELALIKEYKSNTAGDPLATRVNYDTDILPHAPGVDYETFSSEKEAKIIQEKTSVETGEEKEEIKQIEKPVTVKKESEIDIGKAVKEKTSKSDYLKTLAKLPKGRFLEYKTKAQKEWQEEKGSAKMDEDYFKEKVVEYAREEGFI